MTGQNVVLSDKDMDIVQRFRKGQYVNPNMDPHEVCIISLCNWMD